MGRQQGSLVSWYHPLFKWSVLAICTQGRTWVWNNTFGKIARFYIEHQTQLNVWDCYRKWEGGIWFEIYEVYLDSTTNYVKVKTILHLFGGVIVVGLSSFLIFFMGCLSFSVSLEILPYCCKCRTLVQTKSKHSKWESS